MLLVGHTILHLRTGNEVLQFVLVPLVEGFELVVNVDDEVLPDKAQHVLLLWIYFSCIAVIGEGRRTEQVKERGFELADRKSTRLNSSHANISYAVFCLKKNNLLFDNIYLS